MIAPSCRPLVLLAFAAAAALAACEVADLPSSGDASQRDTSGATRDSVATEVAPDIGDGLIACDPEGAAARGGCPADMLCETTARVCVDCVARRQRCVEGRRETCEDPVATGPRTLTGGFYEPDPCSGSDVCVPDGIFAGCAPRVCDPDPTTWRCVSPTTAAQCNTYGSSEVLETCGPGRACYSGQCELIRHNVVLVFDTSGSMHNYLDYAGNPEQCVPDGSPPCLEPWPDCDKPASPLTLFTLAKTTFADAIESSIGSYAQFALQRFPQREAATNTSRLCFNGWYTASDRMTGDDDSRAPAEGAWFDTNRDEVLIVPFPLRNNLDNRAALLGWMDFKERLGSTNKGCATTADCDPGQQCGNDNGNLRCFHHTDDELRAYGETPLGKSLFYAGEYLRRFVRVDGKPCTIDANCGSAGYQCVANVCKDPYRACKDDFIVLFTDGQESEFKDETSFFNPVIQAKRLAFGLDCTGDGDCRGGATCIDSVCVAPGQDASTVPRVAGEGHGALSSPDGQPISVRVTVITLDGQDGKNARIALYGGGASIDVSSSDPEAIGQRLREVMSPEYKCRAEDF